MKVFLSHSAKDSHLVGLLRRLLEFHGIECSDFSLADADRLLVVVSRNSIGSTSMADEIRAFWEDHPSGTAVPLVLDEVAPRALAEMQLTGLPFVDFSAGLLEGFESLFSLLDKPFLELRRLQARSNTDRRKTPTRQRLQYGFWKAYHEATGLGQLEPVEAYYSKMKQLSAALSGPARSYRFESWTGAELTDPEAAVNQAVEEVWKGLGETPPKAVFLIESVTEWLWARFRVVPVTRRATAVAAGR